MAAGRLRAGGARRYPPWAECRRVPAVFEAPDEVRLDRKPNPHLAFGAGAHFCLGAFHARMMVKCLLQKLCDRVGKITLIQADDHVERTAGYQRTIAFDALVVSIETR